MALGRTWYSAKVNQEGISCVDFHREYLHMKAEKWKSVDKVKMGELDKEKIMMDVTARSIRLQGMGCT